MSIRYRVFPFYILDIAAGQASLYYWKSHIKIYDNFFCLPDIRPNLLSPLILKTRQHILFLDPQKSTSHSCPDGLANTTQVQCSKEKVFILCPETNLDNQKSSFNLNNNNLAIFRRRLMWPRTRGGSLSRGWNSRMSGE